MSEQIPASQAPFEQEIPEQFRVPERAMPPMPDVETLKAQARERAIQEVLASRQQVYAQDAQRQTPSTNGKIVYVRRNLTVAELLVVFALSCVVTLGFQGVWGFVSQRLPQIEIKMK